MTAPAPYTTWRKHWPQSDHGKRYTYGVLRVSEGVVFWRRSDGLKGETPVADWGAYTPNGEAQPSAYEIRWGKKKRNQGAA